MTMIGLMVLLLSIWGWGQELLEIPKPTHFEAKVPRSKLVVVKEILPDYNKGLFMANPWSIAVSKSKWLYVYDMKLVKIFIFNDKFEYVGQFLDHGALRGQVNPEGGTNKEISAGVDGRIYLHDGIDDKLLQYTDKGQFLKETILNRSGKNRLAFRPMVDKNGCMFAYSVNGAIIDQLNDKMDIMHSFLSRNLNDCFTIFRPAFEEFYAQSRLKDYYQEKGWLNADRSNTTYSLTADGLLFVFLHRPSSVYLFQGHKMIRNFDVLIDSVLPKYKERLEKALQQQKKMSPNEVALFEIPMFNSCFVDETESFFYLQFMSGKNKSVIYQINFRGKLMRVFEYEQGRVQFKARRNGLFYGLASGDYHPIIVQEKK